MNVDTEVRPLELLARGGDGKTLAWACGACGTVHATEGNARECCYPYDCVGGCGKKLPKKEHRMRCDACAERIAADAQAKRFAAAKKLSHEEWDGDMVYDHRRDEYFPDIGAVMEAYGDDAEEPPEYVWATHPTCFTLDADTIISNQLEQQEHHEDAGDGIHLEARHALQALLDTWVAAHARHVVTYFPDETVAVLIPREEHVETPDEAEALLKANPADMKLQLWAHLVSEHAVILPSTRDGQELTELHQREHDGPCGIRNHPLSSAAWTLEKLREVLAEGEER